MTKKKALTRAEAAHLARQPFGIPMKEANKVKQRADMSNFPSGIDYSELGAAFSDVCKKNKALKADAEIVRRMLELGDHRLSASDGDIGGQLPDLSPNEWGKVYRACKRIAKAVGPDVAKGKVRR